MDLGLAERVAKALIRHFEGCRLRPYLCPAGVPTIGYGATRYVDGRAVRLIDPPITEAQAEAILLHQVRRQFLPAVVRMCPTIVDPMMLAAIIDFTFNLGSGRLRASTLRRRILARRWETVPTELRKWVFAAGRRLNGLVRRREAECRLVAGYGPGDPAR